MNLFKTRLGADATKHKPYEYNGKGLVRVRLLPKQQDQLDNRLKQLGVIRDAAVAKATEIRAIAMRALDDDYKLKKDRIDREARTAIAAAENAFEHGEHEALGMVTQPLTPEQFAALSVNPDKTVLGAPAGEPAKA